MLPSDIHQEYTYPSSDGIHTIYADIYAPKDKAVRAVVQLSHGMVDFVARYEGLAEALIKNGIVFAGNNHLGHGKSAGTPEDLGFFAERDGTVHVLRDLHTMNRYLRSTYPGVPIVLMGHSMGSFIARLFVAKHPHAVDGCIIHGTGGPNPLAPLGHLVAGTIGLFRGQRYRSKALKAMTFSGYNSHFPKSEGPNAWLTRDLTIINEYDGHPHSGFIFTISAYRDLFRFLSRSNAKSWFQSYPKSMPTLIMSGTEDPVGNYGKGVTYVYKNLLLAGVGDVRLHMYEGGRHELFRDTCRNEAYRDIIDFTEELIR